MILINKKNGLKRETDHPVEIAALKRAGYAEMPVAPEPKKKRVKSKKKAG